MTMQYDPEVQAYFKRVLEDVKQRAFDSALKKCIEQA